MDSSECPELFFLIFEGQNISLILLYELVPNDKKKNTEQLKRPDIEVKYILETFKKFKNALLSSL
jgi:hypothetical protein